MTTFQERSTTDKPSLKRKRGPEPSCLSLVAQDPAKEQPQETEKNTRTSVDHPVQNWLLNKKWPSEYFEPDDQTRKELFEHDSWLEEIMAQSPIPIVQYVERNGFRYPLPVKKVPLRPKQSDSSLNESSDQKTRESKSTPYRDHARFRL